MFAITRAITSLPPPNTSAEQLYIPLILFLQFARRTVSPIIIFVVVSAFWLPLFGLLTPHGNTYITGWRSPYTRPHENVRLLLRGSAAFQLVAMPHRRGAGSHRIARLSIRNSMEKSRAFGINDCWIKTLFSWSFRKIAISIYSEKITSKEQVMRVLSSEELHLDCRFDIRVSI